MNEYSRLRKELRELSEEYCALARHMMRPGKMVRGTINWQRRKGKAEVKEYPGITRGVGGKVIGRRVKKEHVSWLLPMLERHKEYRWRERRLRKIHARIMELISALRYESLFDYEPRREDADYLVSLHKEEKSEKK